jgi:hypothetical protein
MFWAFSCDSAAANILFLTKLRISIQLLGVASKVTMYFFWEPCGLHQLARVSLMLLSVFGVAAPMFSLTRCLVLKRNQLRLEVALKLLFEETLDWKQDERPPIRY